MSIQFNDLTNRKGLVQFFEKEVGLNFGDISGNTNRLKDFTADVNAAMDDFIFLAITTSGTFQFDDSNFTDYPIIRTNLVSGQQDYTFTTDQQGNVILDIYKVIIYDSSGMGREITPVYVQGVNSTLPATNYFDGQTHSGVPTSYSKIGNGIFLDAVPNYSKANGLEIYINREGSYFTYTDTTKKPGVPGILHKYFYIKPAYAYATRNNLSLAGGRLKNGAYTGLAARVQDIDEEVKKYFGRRERDIIRRMTPARSRMLGNQSGVL